jgi:hypothetical protein
MRVQNFWSPRSATCQAISVGVFGVFLSGAFAVFLAFVVVFLQFRVDPAFP